MKTTTEKRRAGSPFSSLHAITLATMIVLLRSVGTQCFHAGGSIRRPFTDATKRLLRKTIGSSNINSHRRSQQLPPLSRRRSLAVRPLASSSSGLTGYSLSSSSSDDDSEAQSSSPFYSSQSGGGVKAAGSYDVDSSDQEAEQHLGEHDFDDLAYPSTKPRESWFDNFKRELSPTYRYKDLLDEVGLNHGELAIVSQLPKKRAVSPFDIFCNRELKLSGIRAIGFDMDYTLAQYQQPAFDELAFNGAKDKLVNDFGYPEEVLNFEYDHTRWTRGLIIDTLRGNFLKIDRHKYVRVAFHGMERMSSTTRKLIYSRTFNKVMSFSEKYFVNMDTLFQFVDAHLFALLVEMKDKGEYDFMDFKTYEELYKDTRACVDLCHRDGVIKDEVARDPSKYIVLDKGLKPMMERFRKDGIKLFLVTNSLWEYTSTAMNYLYHGKRVPDEEQKKNEWLSLFDIVVVGSCKPAYMLDPYLNLFRVNTQDGSLRNTDGTYEIDALGEDGASKFLAMGKTFQGGNWLHLQAMLEIAAGEEILYVGDHLYSDVLRSKRTLGWRSAFVVPELEEEMKVFYKNLPLARQVSKLRKLREELDLCAEEMRRNGHSNQAEVDQILKEFQREDDIIKEKLSELAERWHKAFHPIWGAIFNAGYQDSRFAFYVQNYACLYTSRATNLGLASTERSFRTGLEMLPHDKLMDDANCEFVDADPWDK